MKIPCNIFSSSFSVDLNLQKVCQSLQLGIGEASNLTKVDSSSSQIRAHCGETHGRTALSPINVRACLHNMVRDRVRHRLKMRLCLLHGPREQNRHHLLPRNWSNRIDFVQGRRLENSKDALFLARMNQRDNRVVQTTKRRRRSGSGSGRRKLALSLVHQRLEKRRIFNNCNGMRRSAFTHSVQLQGQVRKKKKN